MIRKRDGYNQKNASVTQTTKQTLARWMQPNKSERDGYNKLNASAVDNNPILVTYFRSTCGVSTLKTVNPSSLGTRFPPSMLVTFEKTPSEATVMLVKKPSHAKTNASVMDTTLHVTILLFHSLILHVEDRES